jgi:hypothetical protein
MYALNACWALFALSASVRKCLGDVLLVRDELVLDNLLQGVSLSILAFLVRLEMSRHSLAENLVRSRRLDPVPVDEQQELTRLDPRLVLERLVPGDACVDQSIDKRANPRAANGAGNQS